MFFKYAEKNLKSRCIKLITFDRQIKYTLYRRGCFPAISGIDYCNIADESFESVHECYTCNKDLCNSNVSLVASLLFIFGTLYLYMIL